MKFAFPRLNVGDVLYLKVVEIFGGDGRDVLVSYAGDLLRVQNASRETFQLGDRVPVTVDSVDPLRFRMERRSLRRSGHFDITA